MKTVTIVVLDEVWMHADSASVCVITEEDYFKLCDGEIRTRDLKPIAEIGLKTYGEESK